MASRSMMMMALEAMGEPVGVDITKILNERDVLPSGLKERMMSERSCSDHAVGLEQSFCPSHLSRHDTIEICEDFVHELLMKSSRHDHDLQKPLSFSALSYHSSD